VDQVGHQQPLRPDLAAARDHELRGPHHDQEAEAQQDEPETHLERRGRIHVARAQRHPDPREERREQDDADRVDGLVVGRRVHTLVVHVPEEAAIGVVEREDVERGRLLLEAAPEQRRAQEEDDDDADALLLVGSQTPEQQHVTEERHGQRHFGDEQAVRQRFLRWRVAAEEQHQRTDQREHQHRSDQHPGLALLLGRDVRREPGVAEVTFGHLELREADEHRGAADAEAEAPVDVLTKAGRDDGTECGAEIDAHVEDGEAGIAPRAGLPFVQRADHARDIGLQQADAEHRDREAAVEDGRRRRDRADEVADGDEHAAGEHRVALADELVGDPATGHRDQVGAAREQRVHGAGGFIVDAVPGIGRGGRGREEQDQHGAQPVVGEALEELRHEERGQAAGMSEKTAAVVGRHDRRRRGFTHLVMPRIFVGAVAPRWRAV
jgi:hypothetical protein